MSRDLVSSILLVEDSDADADLVGEYLQEQGWRDDRVERVTTLARAVGALDPSTKDVVLLDLHLPDGQGVECVTAIREKAPTTPVVVLTGMDDDELALQCISAGAQDYLPKSELRPQSLRRSIGYAVARSRELRERVRADALQERLAGIVESTPDLIISCDINGLTTSWNAGAEAMLGYSRDETLGRPAKAFMRPADDAGLELQATIFTRLVHAQDATVRFEQKKLRKDGRSVWIALTATGLRDEAGRVTGVASIGRDITEARRHDDELRAKNAQLRQRESQLRDLTTRLEAVREEERTRISRTVHDELGQLLTALKMDLRWVRRQHGQAPADDVRNRLEEAEKLVDQTIGTVQRIALELRPSALDSLGLVPAIRDELRRFEGRSGLDTYFEVVDDPRPSAAAATGLFRILQELLTNVSRHARATVLDVHLATVDRHWVMRVKDDGVGFAAQAMAHHASLGILGMMERAKALGGDFDIRSDPGGGTIATVRVPPSQSMGA